MTEENSCVTVWQKKKQFLIQRLYLIYAYGIITAFTSDCSSGIASFACKELIALAYQTDPNITIIAKTAPEKNASTKILENNNFVFTEIVQDDEIGEAWLWELKK